MSFTAWYDAAFIMELPAVEIRRRPTMAVFAILAIVMVIASYLFVIVLAAACVYLP